MRRDAPIARENATAEEVARIMRDENVGFVPIVTDETSRRLVGVITDRDLAMLVVAEHRDPRRTAVGYLASREIITASPDEDLGDVERKLADAELRRLPVVDEHGAVVGVVSLHDIAQREDPLQTGRVFREVSKPSARMGEDEPEGSEED
ncbi:MAG: CBS domain-containing protein [Deltaproteobacteria bacterium]|nr:CBS domain-containing protein [Deltaproteobacteria bacterium]